MTKPIILTLNNLNLSYIQKKYKTPTNKIKVKNMGVENTSKTEIKDRTVTFTDTFSKKHICNVSMIDFSTDKDINYLRYHCFWCRNPFNSFPVGCPIRFIPGKICIKYKSISTDNNYEMLEEIKIKDGNPNIKSYYQTDGVFCSFNCCKAFINDNDTDPIYKDSEMLLTKMYNDFKSKDNSEILPAPHWKTLIQYGGFVDITAFRDSFEKMEYTDHGVINDYVNNISIATIYEKKLRF